MEAAGSGMVLAVISREEEYWYKTYLFLMSNLSSSFYLRAFSFCAECSAR